MLPPADTLISSTDILFFGFAVQQPLCSPPLAHWRFVVPLPKSIPVVSQATDGTLAFFFNVLLPHLLQGPAFDLRNQPNHVNGALSDKCDVVEIGLDQNPVWRASRDELLAFRMAAVYHGGEGEEDVGKSTLSGYFSLAIPGNNDLVTSMSLHISGLKPQL